MTDEGAATQHDHTLSNEIQFDGDDNQMER